MPINVIIKGLVITFCTRMAMRYCYNRLVREIREATSNRILIYDRPTETITYYGDQEFFIVDREYNSDEYA